MLAFAKYTHEEALRKTLCDDPGATLRIPGPLSTPSPHLYDYATRPNRTP